MTQPTNFTLRRKLMLAFVGVILFTALISIVAAASITRNRFRSFTLATDIAQSESLAPILGEFYRQSNGWLNIETSLINDSAAVDSMMSQMDSGLMMGSSATPMMWMPPSSRIVVSNAQGQIVADTEGVITGETYSDGRLQNGTPILSDGTRVGTVYVGSMIELVLDPLAENYVRSVAVAIFVTVGIAVAAAFAFSSAFVRRIASPVGEIMQAAKEIASGDLSARVDVKRTDEIGTLAQSFNSMGKSLEDGEERRKQLIADIAHELRTPLSLIRGDLEAILDSVYPLTLESVALVHEETLFLGKLIEDLRELSLLDAGELNLRIMDTDACQSVRRAVRAYENESKRKGITLITAAAEKPRPVKVDAGRIHQVLCNLLDNAIRHTPRNGHIFVGIDNGEPGRPPSFVDLYVKDTGAGIDEKDRSRIFDRFYRPDTSRARATGGTGLGLAISKKIVEAHGGTIRVEANEEIGSRFTISLPTFPDT